MENKNLIMIAALIIVILAAVIGFAYLNPTDAKEPTKINITSDKEQYEDGVLTVELTDLNETPVSKEILNVTVTDSKGELVVDDVVKTNSDGEAKLDLDLDKGNYTVNVTYDGNENYTGNNTTQKLTIKEKEKVVENTPSASQSNEQGQGQEQVDYNSPDSGYFRSETDGNYYPMEPGVDYVYGQDAITGEWSYWLDKS